jgi:hypothetical protein
MIIPSSVLTEIAPDGLSIRGNRSRREAALLSSGLRGATPLTVGFGISPNRPRENPGFAGCTAGRDSHPAPKKPSYGFHACIIARREGLVNHRRSAAGLVFI